MPYTTPFNVWDRLGGATRRQKLVDSLSNGTIVNLEKHILPDETQVLDSNGDEVPSTDYTQDTQYNQLTYTGTDTLSDVTINYVTAPASYERAVRGIDQAVSHIENHLNLTFDGERRRVEEIYETDGGLNTEMMLDRQPVQDVETVWINENTGSGTPNWVKLTEDEDYIQHGATGLQLTGNIGPSTSAGGYTYYTADDDLLSRSPKQIKVTYTYGYGNVPADIQNLAEILLMTDSFIDTVFGAGVDGRDNFDPATIRGYNNKVEQIKGEWTRNHYDNFTTVIEKGIDEEVQ